MKINIDTDVIYMKIANFFYRKIDFKMREPDGVPFRRSHEDPCPSYEPRESRLGDWQDCETDGHYLCSKCCHKVKEPTEMPVG